MAKKQPRTVDCRSHGTTPWLGDMVCAACGWVYLDEAHHPTVAIDGKCRCGAQFTPSSGPADFSARVCCRRCALAKAKTQGAAS